MAIIQSLNQKPFPHISPEATHKVLGTILKQLFQDLKSSGLWLVGGTALSGYYAKHRRSDDLDLFAKNKTVFQSALLATKMLTKKGAIFQDITTTANYYHALVSLWNHQFTLDIVLDENIHQVGHANQTKEGIWVADLNTLLAMKISTLVSRCSEKDLFDLVWLFEQLGGKNIGDLIETGRQIDLGVTTETLLISLQGTSLRKEACHFLLDGSKITVDDAFQEIKKLKSELTQLLLIHEKEQPLSEDALTLKQAVQIIKKL